MQQRKDMPPGVYLDLFMEACVRLCGKRSMDYNDVDQKTPQLPKGASIPRNQVAGHKHEGDSKLGLLEHNDGTILKALQKPPRGTRELEFYKRIFDKDCTDTDVLQLQQFLPYYYGAHEFQEYPGVTYLKLENLVSKFRKPCVVDIKMGKKTYDPEAGPAKIAREMTKFPYVEKFGFQFTGMQTYDPVEDKMKFYDKFFCRKLGEDEVLKKGLGTYFSIKHGLRKDAIRDLLTKLYQIETWFKTQRKFSFYASSLLMVYEGDQQDFDSVTDCAPFGSGDTHSEMMTTDGSYINTDHRHLLFSNSNHPPNSALGRDTADPQPISPDASSDTISSEMESGISSGRTDNASLTASCSSISVDTQTTSGVSSVSTQDSALTEVRMIDFTHVFSVEEQDDNYLYGLQNLIMYMEKLLAMDS